MFKTILLAYDGSDHAKSALKTAAGLAKTFGADLHLCHTPQLDDPPIVVGSFVSQLEAPPSEGDLSAAGNLVADEAEALAASMDAAFTEIHFGRGAPAVHVLAVAERTGADLIVMGRRGVGAARALVLGSVSQAVAHGATCACLTVI